MKLVQIVAIRLFFSSSLILICNIKAAIPLNVEQERVCVSGDESLPRPWSRPITDTRCYSLLRGFLCFGATPPTCSSRQKTLF